MTDREALRAELEATRAAYTRLADRLTPADWRLTTSNSAWTVGQLMWHLAWAAGFVPSGVAGAKRGRGFNPPPAIADRINVLYTRWGARNATPASVKRRYDNAHAKVLTTLAGVKDDEWERGAKTFGDYLTVEGLFHSVTNHFREHAADITRVAPGE